MELSQKLKQARLDAGLSQKALCGNRITRNMLSKIENGSARPSMDTLRYLAGQLGKPVSFFLEEDAVAASPNQTLMAQARQADPNRVLALLEGYQAPDPTFDSERWLLEALACLSLTEEALHQDKRPYARRLLAQAQAAGGRTPYYTADYQRRYLLLCYQAGDAPEALADLLPDLTPELLLQAEAALSRRDYDRCAAMLAAAGKSPHWHYLMARMYFDQRAYADARPHFEAAWEYAPQLCCRALEDCCRELSDFAGAYFYACKLRELNGF